MRAEKQALAHRDAAVLGNSQSGNAVEQRTFPRSGGAKQNRESRRRFEFDIQRKLALGGRKAFSNARAKN